MKLIYAAMALYSLQWVGYSFVDSQWEFLFGTQLLAIALLVSGVFSLCHNRSTLVKSILILWSIMAWLDVLKFLVWTTSNYSVDVSAPIALGFAGWLLFILRRKYDRISDPICINTVTLLIKKPKSTWDMVKSLFGAPAPSICICIGDTIWSFRKRTNAFETFEVFDKFLEDHIAINTGIHATDVIVDRLDSLIGTPRGLACKCVWAIRYPLNMLGGKFRIKTWFDYVPSIYIMRIL